MMKRFSSLVSALAFCAAYSVGSLSADEAMPVSFDTGRTHISLQQLESIHLGMGYVTHASLSGDLLAVWWQRGAVRFAIQAKGYSGSVGNSAVQEAYAGMTFYGCNRCAVITNSEFTSGAAALAAKTGCMLIDGDLIPRLIAGQLSFDDSAKKS